MLQHRFASGTGLSSLRQAQQYRAAHLLQPVRHHRTRRPLPAGCQALPGAGPQPLGDLAKSYARRMNRQNRQQAGEQKQQAEQKQQVEAAASEAKEEADIAAHASEQASASVNAAAQAASVGMPEAAVAAADATNAAAVEALVAADSADAAAGTAVRTAEQAGSSPAVAAPAAEAVGAVVEAAEAASTAAKDADVAEAVREAAVEMISEEVEVIVEARTLQQRAEGAVQFLKTTNAGKGISIAAGLFLAFTFAIAVYRTYQKYTSVGAVRRRQVDKNKQLVESLNKYLPDQRAKLTSSVAVGIMRSSGFTAVEVFRKYLWFLLRERVFDTQAVSDMVQLKQALGLDDAQVAEALRERAQRIYDKYGTLMLQTSGMTPEGVERKATCQALFSKMLYLTECQALLDQDGEAFKTADLRMILGATDEDTDRLRIVSLEEISIESLDRLMGSPASDSAAAAADDAADKRGQGGSSEGGAAQ